MVVDAPGGFVVQAVYVAGPAYIMRASACARTIGMQLVKTDRGRPQTAAHVHAYLQSTTYEALLSRAPAHR